MPDPIDPKTKETGGDTPPPTPPPVGDGNPLFAALFASADKKPAPEKKDDDGIPDYPHNGRSLGGILKDGDEEAERKKKEEADPKKPADKKDEPAKKPDGTAADKQPDKAAAPVKLTRKIKTKDADKVPATVVAAAPAKTDDPEKSTKPSAKFEDSLEPEEKAQIEMLRFAEKHLGEGYKGRAEKMLEFFDKHAKFIEAKKADDPEYDFSDDNPEYRACNKTNMPALLRPSERDRIVKEQAKEEMRIDTDAKLAKQREETEVKERLPQVKKTADAFFSEINDYSMPDDMRGVFKEKGADEMRKLFPDEYEIVEEVTNIMTNGAEEFMAINQGLKKFDPSNKLHVDLDQFINFQCEDFAKNGGEYLIKNGKEFATRAQFSAMSPKEKEGHWTFLEKDVLGLLKESSKQTIALKIKNHLEKQAQRGWTRNGAKPVVTEVKKVDEEPSGKSRPAPSQGGDGKDDPRPANAIFKVLGM